MKKIYFDMDGVLALWEETQSVEETLEPGYFSTRKPDANAIDCFLELEKKGYPVCILSAAYENGYAVPEKTEWLEKYVNTNKAIFVPYGSAKSKYAQGGILIDDYTKNLNGWRKAGGVGVKYYNGVNGTMGTWNGYALDHRTDGKLLAHMVADIAKRNGINPK